MEINKCSSLIKEFDLDESDKKILYVLRTNARASIREIAKKTLLPISTVHFRLKKLKKNVIKRFTIDVDYKTLGLKFKAYVLVKVDLKELKKRNKTQVDLMKKINQHPFVENVDIIAGDYDLVAVVRCKDVYSYNEFLFDFLQKLEFVENTKTLTVIHAEE